MESKFIADKRVGFVTAIEEKTPAGNEMVEVVYSDGKKEKMPKMRFETISTNVISDASSVQAALQKKVGATVFGTLHEFGILMGEAETILNAASDYINAGYEKARDIKWGVEHRYLPLNEVNKVLLENNERERNDGASSSGGGAN